MMKQDLWKKLTILMGMTVILFACAPANTTAPTAAPISENDCPTTVAPTPVSFEALWESSPHADKTKEAFVHWDQASPPEIPVTCARCHSRPGFLDYLGLDGTATDVVDNPVKPGTVITCYVCHNEISITLDSVTFPSGKTVSGIGTSAICVICHQGRASTTAVEIAITEAQAVNEDAPSPDLQFVNSHYISGATPFGSEAQGGYQYSGKTYGGRFYRGSEFFACTRCHDQHSLQLKIETCSDCHTFDGDDPRNIRVNTTDFDGDGDTQEGIYYEVKHFEDELYTAIQIYARDVVGVPIVFDIETHPYFFIDTNNNGVADPQEINENNVYASWTPRLLKASYNYNYVAHDPGAYAHNSTYILQILYDSLSDIGGNVAGKTRP